MKLKLGQKILLLAFLAAFLPVTVLSVNIIIQKSKVNQGIESELDDLILSKGANYFCSD